MHELEMVGEDFEHMGSKCGDKFELLIRSFVKKFALKRSKAIKNSSTPLSIMVLMLDSVSQKNFFRYLPRSSQLIEELSSSSSKSTHRSFFMKNFTVVGKDTVSNEIPMMR